MKILYYSPHPGLNLQSSSGYGTHMREMINAFEKQGHEVLPLIMGGVSMQGSSENRLERKSVFFKNMIKKVIGGKAWQSVKDIDVWRFDHSAKNRLNSAVAEFKPDVIYERANYMQLSGIEIAKKRSIQHCLEVNSPLVEEKQRLSGSSSFTISWAKKNELKQLSQPGIKVLVSGVLKDYYSKKFNLNEKNLLVTPNAINEKDINVDEELVQELKKELDLSGKKVIGFVGSIFKWHGVDILLKAFEGVQRSNLKLLIVGGGEHLPELKKLASEMNQAQNVIFTGYVDNANIFSFIELMDICVLANSNWYGSPVKIFEYGILAKPIIAPNVEPINEVMKAGVDGQIISSNVESLKAAIIKYLSDEEFASSVGNSFKKKIMKRYTWEINAKRVLEKIESL